MAQKKYRGYIGTYTKGESKGIYTFELDTTKEEILDVKAAAELDNPTYLTLSHDNRFLYTVKKKDHFGGAAAFSINNTSGQLIFINEELAEGPSPCHISVSRDNDYVVTANYHKGMVESFSAQPDGSLSPVISAIQHVGSGPNEARQEKPHVHFAGFTPDEKYVVVVDLGIDKVLTYALNNGELKEVSRLSFEPGSGPRHLVFHPHKPMAYVMTELSSEVVVLTYNEHDGSFTIKQTISALPEDFTGHNDGSAIHISSDGRFIYAGNRGHDSIAVFSVNPDTGELTFVEHTATGGEWPRDFILDPSEQYLVALNQHSSNAVLFSRNLETGKLQLLQSGVKVPDPVCIKFLNVYHKA